MRSCIKKANKTKQKGKSKPSEGLLGKPSHASEYTLPLFCSFFCSFETFKPECHWAPVQSAMSGCHLMAMHLFPGDLPAPGYGPENTVTVCLCKCCVPHPDQRLATAWKGRHLRAQMLTLHRLVSASGMAWLHPPSSPKARHQVSLGPGCD